MRSKMEILSRFGLYEKQGDKVQEEARLLALNTLKEIEKKHQVLKESKEYLEWVYYYLGAVLRYVLYLEGREEGNDPENSALWKRNLVKELSPHILDHPRTQGKNLVSYPYSLGLNDLEKIVNVCKAKNLNLEMHGESEYFPGHTFKIVISKKK